MNDWEKHDGKIISLGLFSDQAIQALTHKPRDSTAVFLFYLPLPLTYTTRHSVMSNNYHYVDGQFALELRLPQIAMRVVMTQNFVLVPNEMQMDLHTKFSTA